MHVVFEMKWKKEVRFRCRHSDRVWTQIDSSSWQLPGSSLGFYGANAEIWSVVLGRDQAGSPARAPKPHKHKLAENKVTAEKQPLVQGRLHSTVEPKEMENYTPGTAVQNCSDSQERVIHWAFHLLSKGCDCFSFILLQLSCRLAEFKTTRCFVFMNRYRQSAASSVETYN